MSPEVETLHQVVAWASGFVALAALGLALPALLTLVPDAIALHRRRGEKELAVALAVVLPVLLVAGCVELGFVQAPGAPTLVLWVLLIVCTGLAVLLAGGTSATGRAIHRARARRAALKAVLAPPPPALPAGAAPAPGPRGRISAIEAEHLAAEWMRFLGVAEPVVTPETRDGGVDVRSIDYVVQVKHWIQDRVGVEPIRQLAGVAAEEGRDAVFFSTSGYTRDAVDFARRCRMALFVVKVPEGRLVPIGPLAQQHWQRGLPVSARR